MTDMIKLPLRLVLCRDAVRTNAEGKLVPTFFIEGDVLRCHPDLYEEMTQAIKPVVERYGPFK